MADIDVEGLLAQYDYHAACRDAVIRLKDERDAANVRVAELEAKWQRVHDERANLHNESVRHLRRAEVAKARIANALAILSDTDAPQSGRIIEARRALTGSSE